MDYAVFIARAIFLSERGHTDRKTDRHTKSQTQLIILPTAVLPPPSLHIGIIIIIISDVIIVDVISTDIIDVIVIDVTGVIIVR